MPLTFREMAGTLQDSRAVSAVVCEFVGGGGQFTELLHFVRSEIFVGSNNEAL